jgi:hypothetical protein
LDTIFNVFGEHAFVSFALNQSLWIKAANWGIVQVK